jgi:cobalt/nickel transport system permease protein
MHIPDGLLSLPVALTSTALAVAGLAAASAKARTVLAPRRAALLGVTAAFVFAAQMVNFPVAGGTSGHLLGGVLAVVLAGPAEAVVIMTSVLVLQCLLFGDGGLLALGANILNMAIVHPLSGYGVFRLLRGPSSRATGAAWRTLGAAFIASLVSTVLTAVVCAGELALSRVVTAGVVLPAMVSVHVLVAMGEATITTVVLSTLLRLRPQIFRESAALPVSPARIAGLGLTVAAAIALFVTPFACSWPDGLEHVVEQLGIEPARAKITLPAPLRDYLVPGLPTAASTSIAALLGTLLVFGLTATLAGWLSRAPKHNALRSGGEGGS